LSSASFTGFSFLTIGSSGIVGESWHRVHAICRRYVDLALAGANLSALTSVAIDETSYRRGHSYLTLAADADAEVASGPIYSARGPSGALFLTRPIAGALRMSGWPYQPYERRVPSILEPSCLEYARFWYEPLALDRI
jgi:hypothetical protein